MQPASSLLPMSRRAKLVSNASVPSLPLPESVPRPRVSRVRESSSVPPANGEPTPRRTGRTRSRAQGRHCGTSEGQTETSSIPRRRHNPSHPTLIPGDLSDWMQDRHADLQDAMNGGNCVKVLELTSMMSNGTEKLAEMTGGMAP